MGSEELVFASPIHLMLKKATNDASAPTNLVCMSTRKALYGSYSYHVMRVGDVKYCHGLDGL